MEDKLQEILNDSEETIERYEYQVKDLENKINFYSQHKLEEELRITRIKHDCLNMAIYRWRKQQTALRDLLNAWNS